MTDNQSSNARFAPTAWTPARCALWNALEGNDRKQFEQWVMSGNTREIPEQHQARYEEVKDIKKTSSVPGWLMTAMLDQGWLENNINTNWAQYYGDD